MHRIPAADERRDGYTRTHRVQSLERRRGAGGRLQHPLRVLIAGASEAPSIASGCKITGGEWLSCYYDYYDAQEVEDAGKVRSCMQTCHRRRTG